MIVECSQCRGLSRVDDAGLSPSAVTTIRCPHCHAEGALQFAPALNHGVQELGKTGLIGPSESPPLLRDEKNTEKRSMEGLARENDPTLPEDTFQNFHTHSGKKIRAPRTQGSAFNLKLLLWAGLSLGIVLVFALLVNLILPGPAGERSVTGTGYQDSARKP